MSRTLSEGHTSRLRPFQLNIEPAERIDELKLDVTAPMIAARPRIPMTGGTACANSTGITSAGFCSRRAIVAAGHGYAKAATPIRSGGATNVIVSTPARIEWPRAFSGV